MWNSLFGNEVRSIAAARLHTCCIYVNMPPVYIWTSILQYDVDPLRAVRYCVQKEGKPLLLWQDLRRFDSDCGRTDCSQMWKTCSASSVSSRVYSIETNWVSLDMRVSLKSLYRALNNCLDRCFLFILNQMNILISQEAVIPTTRSVSEANNVIGPWKSAALVMVKDPLWWVPQLWPRIGTFIPFIDRFKHYNIYLIPLKIGDTEIGAVWAPPGGRWQ